MTTDPYGAARFAADTRNHQLTILRDDGQKRIAEARATWNAACGRGASTVEKDAAWKEYQRIESKETFQFHDWTEWDLTDWSWHYLRACNAVAWGVRQYDEAKAARPVEAVAS